jgi:hypothetical protein
VQDVRSFHGYGTLCQRLKHPPNEALMERYIATGDRPCNPLLNLSIDLIVQVTMRTVFEVQLVTRYLACDRLSRQWRKRHSFGNWMGFEPEVTTKARVIERIL